MSLYYGDVSDVNVDLAVFFASVKEHNVPRVWGN